MKRFLAVPALMALAGCAALDSGEDILSPETEAERTEQEAATRAYIEQLGARRVDSYETYGEVYFLASNQSFAEVISAGGRFIVEVEGPCEGLIGAQLQGCSSIPRPMAGDQRNRDDLFCGCPIIAIYAVENRGHTSDP